MRKYKKKKIKRERVSVIIRKTNSTEILLRSTIDYKNLPLLRKFISSQGKILPRKVTRLTAKEQRNVTNAIKTARVAGLLPFINQ